MTIKKSNQTKWLHIRVGEKIINIMKRVPKGNRSKFVKNAIEEKAKKDGLT